MEPDFPLDLDLPAVRGRRGRTLHARLRAAILDGRLAAGAMLPSTRNAAAALGVARNTVAAAYDRLVAEGYVLPRTRARPVVADLRARRGKAAAQPAVALNPAWRRSPVRAPLADAQDAAPFRLGLPEHRLFPHAAWRRLVLRALRAAARGPFAQGDAAGLPVLRAAIARHVAFARAVACGADDVLVTAGAQQAFDLLARLLVAPGGTRVAVEDPGYPGLRAAFRAAGAQLVPVPVDGEGLRVDRLGEGIGVVCVTPSHQFPAGVAMSLARRMALLAWARAHGAVIVEDDYDGEFRAEGRPLDALHALDTEGRVCYVGTFSKCMFPSLRAGYVVAPPWARERLAALKRCTDAQADTVQQSALAAFIEEGHLARHVRRMRLEYGRRRAALEDGIAHWLGEWLVPVPSAAGLHLSARIRRAADAPRIVAAARRHLPGAQPWSAFALRTRAAEGLTLGFGLADVPAIERALRALRQSLLKTALGGESQSRRYGKER